VWISFSGCCLTGYQEQRGSHPPDVCVTIALNLATIGHLSIDCVNHEVFSCSTGDTPLEDSLDGGIIRSTDMGEVCNLLPIHHIDGVFYGSDESIFSIWALLPSIPLEYSPPISGSVMATLHNLMVPVLVTSS
jgi:hypothetical protein